ncbi:MAG: prephenate dehydrogenase [Ruminiclostridium sp.]|nr:prephenate dehydrogenase [Ruminiclostridium sp.]
MRNMENLRITIIGLGLIGGSLARAFHERMGMKDIIAVNRSGEALQQALRDGAISRGYTEMDSSIYESDIIFICTPVKRALQYIDDLSGKVRPDCIITDVGSTKGELVTHVNTMKNPPCFIGGHPMAGTEKTGYASGFAHLFENAYYILTPCKSTPKPAMESMMDLARGIGAIPVIMDAYEHDRVTGGISHIPHIIASALVNMVKGLDSCGGSMQMFAAGGFRDITRIASSSPEMWESIVMSNKHQLKELLDNFVKELERFKKIMAEDDSQALLDFFSSAKKFRDSMPASRNGLIAPIYELIINVIDKPGIIGEIATILGRNNINIMNINVTNSREFEQGCLKITLVDSESVNIAFDLLKEAGYKVYMNK